MTVDGKTQGVSAVMATLITKLTADVYDNTPGAEAVLMHGAFLLIAESMRYGEHRKAHFARWIIEKNKHAQQSHDPESLERRIHEYLRRYPLKHQHK